MFEILTLLALLASPGGVNRVEVEVKAGAPVYRVLHRGKQILDWSPLGFTAAGGKVLGTGASVKIERTAFDETWEQPWGEERFVRNRYRELRVTLSDGLAIRFRAYDDGVAFRYEYQQAEPLVLASELTGFRFVSDAPVWWIPAFEPNRYEYLYRKTRLSAMPVAHTPATVELGGITVAIHEAALVDFASMTLTGGPNGAVGVRLVPWKDGTAVKTDGHFVSPWRTLQIADTPGALITSYLSLNLNEPNRLGDTSWVKPRKYIGIWWEMHLGTHTWQSGERHGATTARALHHIELAVELGIPGLLIEGWNVGWDGNWFANGDKFSFTEPYPDFDLARVAAYAREKHIALIGHNETAGGISNYERQADGAFALYEKLGIDTIKTGYVGARVEGDEWHHGQFMVRHHKKITELAARHHVALDIHEPIKDTGLRRTYPNLLSREGARGMEYDAWSDDGGNPPEHATIVPFTRGLSGPFDMTPGIFDLTRGQRPNVRSWTTLAKQLALYVVIFSPVAMAADLPENYLGQPAFRFIRDVPVDWHTTRVLAGKIGEFVAIARRDRHSTDWYLGAVTDEQARTLRVKLDFLAAGRYQATLYKDGKGAHYKSNPLPVEIETRTVSRRDSLPLVLAAGGGIAIRFQPLPK